VPEAALQQDLATGQAIAGRVLGRDIVVLGAPMYNFTIPSQLKAWIDRNRGGGKKPLNTARRRGRTGRQQARDRRDLARWISTAGTPAAAGEYVKPICAGYSALSGQEPRFISADGVQVWAEHREKALAGALQAATNLALHN